MKTIVIPKYFGTGKTHNSTSYYILPTPRTDDLDTYIHRSVNNTVDLYSYTIPGDVVIDGMAYVYVVMNMSDGGVIQFPIKPIDGTDIVTEYTYDELPVYNPIIITARSTLKTGGSLSIVVSPMVPFTDNYKDTVVILKNRYNRVMYIGRHTTEIIDIPIADIKDYVEGGDISIYVWHTSKAGIMSKVTKKAIPDIDGDIKLISHAVNINPKEGYEVRLSTQLTITNVSVYLNGKLVESVNGATIMGNDMYGYDKQYDIRVTLDNGGSSLILRYIVSTANDYQRLKIDKSFTLNNSSDYENIVISPRYKYLEQTVQGYLHFFKDNNVSLAISLSSDVMDISTSFINIGNNNDTIVRVVDAFNIQVIYTTDVGIRYSALLRTSVSGDIVTILDNTELTDDMGVYPIYVLNSETVGIALYNIVVSGGIYHIKDIKNNVIIDRIYNVNNINEISLMNISSQNIVVWGSGLEALYIFDYNLKILNNVMSIPTGLNGPGWIYSYSNNGNLMCFKVDGDIYIEINYRTSNVTSVNIGSGIKGVLKYKDGSYSIVTENIDNITLPTTNACYRLR